MKKTVIATVVLAFCSFGQLNAQLFKPSDAIWGVQVDGDSINVGVAGTTGGVNNWPAAESPEHAIDGVGQKYLNFGKVNTGIIVTPSGGFSIVNSLLLWTANDSEPRDPSGYEVWGTSAAIEGSGPFSLADFTAISTGSLSLPSSRNDGGDAKLVAENQQVVGFANDAPYSSYLIVFPDVKDNANANSMQIAEVQLCGAFVVVPEPSSIALTLLGLAGLVLARRRK